jgi:hypothetical protein
MVRFGAALAAALWLTATAPATAQVKLGEVAFANSGAASAQADFLAGLGFLHNFEYPRAAEAFKRAQAADPGFAMAYWGEAMTYNHAVWMEQNATAGRAALARLGATTDARLAKAPTPREREYLQAVETLYGAGDKEARDFVYADAMAKVHRDFPDDVDATAFYALSLLGTSHQGRDTATYMRSAALLEEVYPSHLHHPGVLHYLIHSYDDPVHAPLGLRAARLYGAEASGAPHALHMTSHIFLALGMWDDVIKSNEDSTAALNALRASRNMKPTGCGHAFSWLMYGYLQAGRDADARQRLAACRNTAMVVSASPNPVYDYDATARASFVEMRVMQAVATGRWDSADDLPMPETGADYERFTSAYGRGLAAHATGDAAGVKASAAELASLRPRLVALLDKENVSNPTFKTRLDVVTDQMAALAQIRSGQTAAGLAKLKAAADREAAMTFEFGPPMIEKPTHELLGDELARLGRKDEAAAAYRVALARAPGRRQSVIALAKLGAPEQVAAKAEPAPAPHVH